MYVFFEPELRDCDENTLRTVATANLALSPNQYENVYAEARQKLERAGFHRIADVRDANPRIELYGR